LILNYIDMIDYIEKYIAAQKATLDSIDPDQVADIIKLLDKVRLSGGKIFIVGNGGSASNASHFATDLGKSATNKVLEVDRKPFKVLSLTDNVSWITAIANDYKYEDVFWRQLDNFIDPLDILIAVSVSGNSPNCVSAISLAKDKGAFTIALVGDKNDKSAMANLAHYHLKVSGKGHYGRIEDAQMTVLHMLCYYFVEEYKKQTIKK